MVYQTSMAKHKSRRIWDLQGELQNLERRQIQTSPDWLRDQILTHMTKNSHQFLNSKERKDCTRVSFTVSWLPFYYRFSFPQNIQVFVFFIKLQVKEPLQVVRKQSQYTKQEKQFLLSLHNASCTSHTKHRCWQHLVLIWLFSLGERDMLMSSQ